MDLPVISGWGEIKIYFFENKIFWFNVLFAWALLLYKGKFNKDRITQINVTIVQIKVN